MQNSKPYCKEEVTLFAEGENEHKVYSIDASLKPMSKDSSVKIEVEMTLDSKFCIIDCKVVRSNENIKTTEKYLIDQNSKLLHYTFMHDGEKTQREFPINEQLHIATPAISTLFFMTLKDAQAKSFKLYSSANEWSYSSPPTINDIVIEESEQNEKLAHFEIDSVVFKTKHIKVCSFDGSNSEVIQSEFFNLPLDIQFESISIRAQVFKVFTP